MRTLTVEEREAGQRLDRYLKKYMPEAGSAFFYKMLRKKNITLNGKRAAGHEILAANDEIRLFLADATVEKFGAGAPENLPAWTPECFGIVYEDADFLIVSKPAGMLAQKARPGDWSLNEYLEAYLRTKGEGGTAGFRPAAANRLDRNTSGLVLCGKSIRGLQYFSEVLRARELEKYYLCLVEGVPDRAVRKTAWLAKDEKKNQVTVADAPFPGAAPVETGLEPLWSNGRQTLVRVRLYTGKTHQIRSHLAHLGYPIVGDPKYRGGGRTAGPGRQFLHAWQVVFPDAGDTALAGRSFSAPLPADLETYLKKTGCPGHLSAPCGAGGTMRRSDRK